MRKKIKSPRCPECGKALYRTLRPKEKRQTALYPYCRNESCRIYGDIRIVGYNPGNPGKDVVLREKSRTSVVEKDDTDVNSFLKRRKRRIVEKIESEYPKETTQSNNSVDNNDSISYRSDLSKIIKDDKAKKITALSVVVILQELGDEEIAKMVINKHKLDCYFTEKKERNDARTN